MEAAEQTEGPDSPPQTRPKRSRTGCLTCRTRRRKCDEGKPKCQNCISKGFECRYAEAFQFLGRNNFTPEVPSSTKYTKLRVSGFIFVDIGGFISDEANKEEHAQVNDNENEQVEAPKTPALPQTSPPAQAEAGPPPPRSPPADNYEFALHGLLALGSGNAGVANVGFNLSPRTVPADSLSSNTLQDEMTQPSIAQAEPEGGEQTAGLLAETQATRDWQLANAIDLPQERVLELLRHYRYEVAPWVDICDMNQSFGCGVLQMSTESRSIRSGLLALADASLISQELNLGSGTTRMAIFANTYPQQDLESNLIRKSILEALATARRAVVDLSGFWMKEASKNSVLEELLPEANNLSLISSIYWFLVRLELSAGLANGTPIQIPLPYPATLPRPRSFEINSDTIFQYANRAVALCADAVMFCQGDNDIWSEQRYGNSRIETWNALIRGFDDWYSDRPQDFQAIIELYPRDGRHSEHEFPILVFASGAAILANQLYHTGMLLLLQNKPRFATIMANLEAIQRLTGWNLAHNLNSLTEEWRLAEGW
ncbi:hypothetical protein K469DRAFT_572399 [Zopfia rhizophila CBS 207.26]|uniref:Zn(2)-C6 fungal-type domain-containing protein n=1 Tax=Zopfia rhizophila CBS 207.26 TaxID=1314779 RepID=A0A6A6E3S7_9PEZI|nr:hypothetical protein K469DRAFT_572399 [Zopfia rhizophila CBS 207.26]